MIYEERIYLVAWAQFLIVDSLLLLVGGLIACWVIPGAPWVARILLLVLTPIMLLVFLAFRSLTIEVKEDVLRFGFGPFRARIPLADIEGCEREDITFRRYGGIGLHHGIGAVCYNTRFGPGLRIRVRGRRRVDYVLGTDRPEELARALGHPLKGDRGSGIGDRRL
jgi:hypothetical protein